MTKKPKQLPFWELGLNPITMKRPVRYHNEENATHHDLRPIELDQDIYVPPIYGKLYDL